MKTHLNNFWFLYKLLQFGYTETLKLFQFLLGQRLFTSFLFLIFVFLIFFIFFTGIDNSDIVCNDLIILLECKKGIDQRSTPLGRNRVSKSYLFLAANLKVFEYVGELLQ